MSELQLSLLIIGVLVVVGVFLYGWWQQYRYQRSLKRPARESREKQPVASVVEHTLDIVDEVEDKCVAQPVENQPQGVEEVVCEALNEQVDYIVSMVLPQSVTANDLQIFWQHKFEFGQNLVAYGKNITTNLWERLIPESTQSYRVLCFGVQLLDRTGVVSEARLARVRDVLKKLADDLQVEVVLPEVPAALQRARELDQFCAEVDQLLVINLVRGEETPPFASEVADWLARIDILLQADGEFHLLNAQGETIFKLGVKDGQPFNPHTLNQTRVEGLTLLLDLPRVQDPVKRFDEMVAISRELAQEMNFMLVDDRGIALSEGILMQVRAGLTNVQQRMLEKNIVPGSTLALRLFS